MSGADNSNQSNIIGDRDGAAIGTAPLEDYKALYEEKIKENDDLIDQVNGYKMRLRNLENDRLEDVVMIKALKNQIVILEKKNNEADVEICGLRKLNED